MATELTALLLIRTPLQAWIAERVLKAEGVTRYDLVYFTQNDSTEDKFYYQLLAAGAVRSQYCHVPLKRYDILGHIDFFIQSRTWRRKPSPDLVMLASYDSPVINALASVHKFSRLVTFDDGTANIFTDGLYHLDIVSRRMKLYRCFFRATSPDIFKDRISRHYTIYPGFINIVENARLRYINGWQHYADRADFSVDAKVYFIGQPYEEVLNPAQIGRLEEYLRTKVIHSYVRHPRERSPINIDLPFLDKQGRVAEDAILADAGDRPIHIIGWFSSVMLNLAAIASKRTMILLNDHPASKMQANLALQSGCEIVFI